MRCPRGLALLLPLAVGAGSLAAGRGSQAPPAQGPASSRLVLAQTLEPGFALAGEMLADFTGDGRAELLLIGEQGQLGLWRGRALEPGAAGRGPLLVDEPSGRATLSDPARSLLAVAALGSSSVRSLIVAGPKGTAAYVVTSEGALPAEGRRLASRARNELRVGVPTFAPFVSDVNRDGRVDLVLPGIAGCELWLDQGPDAGAPAGATEPADSWPTYRRTARISLEVLSWGSRNGRDLSNVLESSFAIPGLQTRDVNGDGRPDLLVVEGQRRSFHLQGENGEFPLEPTVQVDVSIFRDTLEAGGVRPGQTLTVDEGGTFEITDLDRDGIPDYVIAQGRKVWVFHGGRQGPQFKEPSTILKAAEDVTALTVLRLDDDELPDLILIKVQVPTIATLVRGLFGEWDIKIDASGYRNEGGRTFEKRPSFKSQLVLRLPSLLDVLRDPSDFLEPLEKLESRFNVSKWADLDGDGRQEVLRVSEDGARLEVWRGVAGEEELQEDQVLRQLLFEDQETVWDFDRILLWLGNLAERRMAMLTGGRPPDIVLELRPKEEARLTHLDVADVDGDGRAEVLLGYRPLAGGPGARIELLRFEEDR